MTRFFSLELRFVHCLYVQDAGPQKYGEVTDQTKLLTVIEGYLSDYNLQNKSRMDLVLFLYAAEHICRISRIIKQPFGNALLVGPSLHNPTYFCSARTSKDLLTTTT